MSTTRHETDQHMTSAVVEDHHRNAPSRNHTRPDTASRRTKIACTLGPATSSPEVIAALLDLGINVARMNFSHGDHADHQVVHHRLRGVNVRGGSFMANSAWLALAAMAFNLTRAVGALAGRFHAKADTATNRTQLITVAARITRSARRANLRLPTRWPWSSAWQRLFTAAIGPPATP
jgi:hypothetical protein